VAFTTAILALLALSASGGEPPPPPPPQQEPELPPGPTAAETAREMAEFAKKHSDPNAALHYMQAMVELASRRKDDDVETFIARTLQTAPPAILAEYPEAEARLRAGLVPVTVWMHRGAQMKRCTFDLDWSKGAGILMPHLGRVRNLARAAVACGKWYEFRKRPAEAAQVYLDVCRMGCHMNGDPVMISELVGMAVVGMGVRALEGMLARGVDAETGKLILEGLRELPEKPFSMAEAVDAERIVMGGWARLEFTRAARQGRAEVIGLLGRMMGRELKWHEKLLVPVETDKIVSMIDRGYAVYDAYTKDVVAAMRKPFAECISELKKLTDKDRVMQRATAAKVGIVGILINAEATAYERSRIQEARTEAALRAVTLLAAAARVKAERGKYPGKLEQLVEYFGVPGKHPKDPFTGGDFSYKLDGNGLPVVETPGDDPNAGPGMRQRLYIFGFSAARGRATRAHDQWRAQRGILVPGPEAPAGEEEEVF